MKPLTEPQLQELVNVQLGKLPDCGACEQLRVRLKNHGLVWRDEGYPWQWHLTAKGRDEFLKLSLGRLRR